MNERKCSVPRSTHADGAQNMARHFIRENFQPSFQLPNVNTTAPVCTYVPLLFYIVSFVLFDCVGMCRHQLSRTNSPCIPCARKKIAVLRLLYFFTDIQSPVS